MRKNLIANGSEVVVGHSIQNTTFLPLSIGQILIRYQELEITAIRALRHHENILIRQLVNNIYSFSEDRLIIC